MARKIRNQKTSRRSILAGQKGLSADKIKKIFGSKENYRKARKVKEKMPRAGKRGKSKHHNVVKAQAQAPPPPPPLPVILKEAPRIYSEGDVTSRMEVEKLNSSRLCIFNCPKSLRTILFSEPIARYYKELGYKIIWPVSHNLTDFNKHSDYITFINTNYINTDNSKNFVNKKGILEIPIQYAHTIIEGESDYLKSIYKLWDMSVSTYKSSSWIRDKESESKLFTNILGLDEDEKFNLVNEYYHNDFGNKASLEFDKNIKTIYMEKISNFTILDWSKVAEKAQNIYTVNNSFSTWLQFLNLSGKKHITKVRDDWHF
jgi:hypothetical protein